MQQFVGILRNEGQEGSLEDVQLYLQTLKGIISALNRIDYTKCSLEDSKTRLDELLGKTAKDLGISEEGKSNVPAKF